jgi:hypothetical protein
MSEKPRTATVDFPVKGSMLLSESVQMTESKHQYEREREIHHCLSKLYENVSNNVKDCEKIVAKFKKNKRFRQAHSYWSGVLSCHSMNQYHLEVHMKSINMWPPDYYPPVHPSCKSVMP